MTCRHITGWLVLAAGLIACQARASDGETKRAEARPALVLRDVMWQMLPNEVRGVSVGPDDRLWIEVDGPEVELAGAKETIAREFARPSPQLAGVRPVLFEPGGRVWFRGRSNRFLLGYDGREWIEKQLESGHWFIGDCPGNCREDHQPSNQFAAGRAFFPETHGVHAFDGQAWSWLETVTPGTSFGFLRLIREPDGAGLLMTKATTPPQLWRFRDGSWAQMSCAMEAVAEVCPAPGGRVWLFRTDGRVETVAAGDSADADRAANARKMGDRLRAATTADERRAAAQDLATAASPALLEEMLSTSYDPDFLAALARAIKGKRQPAASRLGEYTAAAATLIGHDDAGQSTLLLVRGAARGETPLGDGLLVASNRQEPRFIAAPQVLDAWRRVESRPRVIFTRDGRAAWVGRPDYGTAAFRIDLDTGVVTDRVPEPLYGVLHAVRDDGTVFVSNSNPSLPGCMVAAFRPGRPDDYVPLPAESWPLQEGGPGFLGLDAGGGIWAILAGRGLARFHEGGWQPVNAGDLRTIRGIIAGSRDDVILIGSRFGYWRAGEISWAATMQELLAANRAAIAASFGTGQRPRDLSNWFAVAADEAGHLWLLDVAAGGLSVLVGDRWIDARPPLVQAGARGGFVQLLAAAGGRKVYVSNVTTAHGGSRSFFGEVEAGRPVFRDAPATYLEVPLMKTVRDQRGALWLPTSKRTSAGSADWIHGQLAIRIVDGRVDAELENKGWAAVGDAGGVVWLANPPGRPSSTINLWRDGALAGTLVIPGWCNGLGDHAESLFSDRPGSVVARTARGLTHFVAAGEPATYRVAARYALTGVEGMFTSYACSRSGVLVGTARRGLVGPSRSQSLVIVRLPPPPELEPLPAGKP
jgi:hypothetical protein